MSGSFLTVQNLKTHFLLEKGVVFRRVAGNVRAVDGVSLQLEKGEILGLVGESGCGKSTLGRTILQLIPPTEGVVVLEGTPLNRLPPEELRAARSRFQMIFQDPYASLNPRMSIYDILAEALQSHRKIARKDMPRRVAELMERVGLSPRYIKKYPHEFSGGQRQRIAIARALAVEPQLIIADEPVSALDVSIQAQILNLLTNLCRDLGLTMIFISHDLSVVRHIARRIAVMYLGKIVELGPAEEVFLRPLHPYTQALISAVPIPDPVEERNRRRILLQGDPPSPTQPPSGCSFHPRCPFAKDYCAVDEPALEEYEKGREASCLRIRELSAADIPK